MGQRLASSLSIAFMSRIEAPVLDLRPTLYCRYIDDCFIIAGKATMRLKEDFSLNKVPFNLPFISDEVTVAIKRCLKRAGLENSV